MVGGEDYRLPALALELVQLNVDIIVVTSTQAARAAKQATSKTPIVMALGAYPDKIGLVESLARPGGNVTGLSNVAPDLMGKRFHFEGGGPKKLLRVAVLWNPRARVELFGFSDTMVAGDCEWPGDQIDRGAHARGLPRGIHDRDREPCGCAACLR